MDRLSELEQVELLPHLTKPIIEYGQTKGITKVFWEEPVKPEKAMVYLEQSG